MDEKNVLQGKVFQNPEIGAEVKQPAESSTPPEQTPLPQPVPVSTLPTQPPVQLVGEEQSNPPQNTIPVSQESSTPPQSSFFSISNIIKLLIGLFAVMALAFILLGLVLPSFTKKEQKVELTYWGLSDDSAQTKTILSDFEKQNPNIKVNYEKQDLKDYKDRLVARSQNGTGPDVFRFHNTWVLQLSSTLLPIPSDVITKDQFDKTFYPVAKHDLVRNGAIYGLPLDIDVLSLFINFEMFKQAGLSAPTNWNDFINTARSLTLKDQTGKIKTAGASLGAFDNITHAPDIISLLFAQDSVNLDDISQTKTRVSDALNFYTGFALSDGSVWDATLDQSILAFSKGNLAMYFGYYRDLPVIKSSNPNLSFEIKNVPHLTGQNMTMSSYYPIGVSLKSKHQKEALLLIKFLTQKNISEELSTQASARMDVVDKTKGQAKTAVSSYFSGETFDNGLNSQLNSHLGNAVNSIILNNGSVDAATDTLLLGFSQVINQFLPKQ